MRTLIAGLLVGALAGCSLLGRNTGPRPDDPNAKAPAIPVGAATWTSLDWQETTFDRPPKASEEQWDQATALAKGPSGWVAVGSNSDTDGYVGRTWHSVDSLRWRLVATDQLDDIELVGVAATVDAYVAIGTDSTNINAAVAIVLRSEDGERWEEVERIQDAWAARVAAGPRGFAVLLQAGFGDTTDLLLSPNGIDWRLVDAVDIEDGDAWLADVAWERDGWLAVGSAGNRAVALRSAEGVTWAEDALPAAGPIDGVHDVSAYRVVPGRWATLILGLDREPECVEDDEFCGKHQAAWSWTAATGWQRLPKSTWLLNLGYGIHTWPAGDAGFVAGLEDVRISADGWSWTVVGPGAKAVVRDALVADGRLVSVGASLDGAPDLISWFGSAIIGR